jgi:D-alanyl-D-alanine carboxypeptidase
VRWKRLLLTAAMMPGLLTVRCMAVSSAPDLSAQSAILMDMESGRVLYEKNADEERLIASITKIMTALVALESTPNLDEVVTIQREYTLTEGSSMYLKVGEEVTIRDLLYGLLLSSGNDAALAIAGVCAGDTETFVDWMNQRAESLGMTHTHFANPNGLNDDAHYSTARDMATLTREALQNPTFAEIVSTKSITLGERSLTNHNKMLWQYEGAIGVKTGYTQMAGRTLVSAAARDGQTLIVVTLNDPDDWADHAALLDWGFEQYPRTLLCREEKVVAQAAVMDGTSELVPLETVQNVWYPLGEDDVVRAKWTLPETVLAPVRKGAIAGELTFYLGDQVIGRSYLAFSGDVAQAPQTLWDKIKAHFGRGSAETLALFGLLE